MRKLGRVNGHWKGDMVKRAELKKQKQEQAEVRRKARSKRTDKQQLELIAGRRGKSAKETKRLSQSQVSVFEKCPKKFEYGGKK